MRTLPGPYLFPEGHASVGSEGVVVLLTTTGLAKVAFDRQVRNGAAHQRQENYVSLAMLEEMLGGDGV